MSAPSVHRPFAPAAAACLALVAFAAACAPDRAPAAAPRLVDRAGVLDEPARARVERYLRFVREERGIDYRVVLEAPAGAETNPERAAERWFRELEAGAGTEGRGLLLWLDPERRRARIEVGYALEGAVPDLAAGAILEGYLAPHARGEALAAGIEAAIEGVVDRLRLPGASTEESPEGSASATAAAPGRGSGGAGARLDLADAPGGEAEPLALDPVPQPDPRAARDLELALLAAGRYEPASALYDEAWRRSSRHRRWSPDRLRELALRFDRPYEIEIEGDHAVASYVDAPELGPTLLRQQADGWTIDATAGARLVVYDYSNERWYLVDEPSPYVELLRGVLPLERGRLEDGRAMWWRPR